MIKRLLAASLLSVFALGAHAEDLNTLAAQAGKAYKEKQYPDAAARFAVLSDKAPDNASMPYNAACAYALAGDAANALRFLELAFARGYRDVEHAAKDGDFASIRQDARFAALIERTRTRLALDARLWDSPALKTPYQPNISDAEKLAGLAKFWSEVKYNFVYVEKLKELDWDQLLLETMPKALATRSTAEYYRVLAELCARLQDGHTNVFAPQQVVDAEGGRALVKTTLIEGRVFVTEVADPALRDAGVVHGVEVVAVEGVPVREHAARNVAPLQSSSTPQFLDWMVYDYGLLTGATDKPVRVTFARADGKRFDAPVRRVGAEAYDKAFAGRAPFEMRMLPGNVAYVALNTFGNAAAANAYLAAFPEIAKARALIVDVRNNGGGDSIHGYRVLATLVDKPFALSGQSTRDYRPTFRARGTPMPDHVFSYPAFPPDAARHFDKPVVVLTSPLTFSSAEDFVVAFDAARRGRIVGEPTGGSTGQPLWFKLPGGGSARICTKRDTYPDGKPFVGVGVQPQARVTPTVKDFRAGRDTVLEEALRQLAL